MANVQLAVAGDETTQVILSVPGVQGPAGSNLPPSGTTHQLLYKQSNTDYDTAWKLITNDNVDAAAAIAGTKISPNFGSQNVLTTGTSTAASFIPSSSSVPTNGLYLPSANSVALSTSGTPRVQFGTSEVVFNDDGNNYDFRIEGDTVSNLFFVDASADKVGIGTSSPNKQLELRGANDYTSMLRFSYGSAAPTYYADWGYSSDGNKVYLTITDNGVAKNVLVANYTGNVGIGTTSPSNKLDVNGNAALLANGQLKFADATNQQVAIIDNGGAANTSQLRFLTGSSPTERARIDSSGRLLVGTSTGTSTFFGVTPQLQLEGVNENGSSLSIFNNQNSSTGAYISIGKSRGSATGSSTIVNSGDTIGAIYWVGADGTDRNTPAAQISCQVDGTPGSNDMPGRLVFSVTADGAASPTEALRISSNRAITVSDGGHIVLGTGTGTKIGTSTSQKIGFFDETPIVQPTTGIAEAAFVENSGGTAVNVDSTFGGYTIQQVVQALQNLGLLA